MSFQTYALSAGTRLGEDGFGAHQLYYRSLAHAVSKPDPEKRSRIKTSQSVGAWVPQEQMRKRYSDQFISTYELSPVKCTYREGVKCKWSPLRNHYYDPVFAAEDFTRKQ